jgi:hypothetical protein
MQGQARKRIREFVLIRGPGVEPGSLLVIPSLLSDEEEGLRSIHHARIINLFQSSNKRPIYNLLTQLEARHQLKLSPSNGVPALGTVTPRVQNRVIVEPIPK